MPKYPYHKKLQHFVLWWFYVRLDLVNNILKVGQNWSMGRCPISKMTFVDLQVISLHFYPGFQLQYFTWKCYQWCWIIPYTISRATCTPAPLSVALIKTCEAGLVLSVTRILEPHCPNSVFVCVCVCVYVCNYSFQTTEPICIKIIPAMGYLDLKYLPPPYL